MHTDLHRISHTLTHPIEYDARQRRLWIMGQRCHHGATGVLLGAGCVLGLAAGHLRLRSVALAAALGAVLAADDWHDRSMWFRAGHGV